MILRTPMADDKVPSTEDISDFRLKLSYWYVTNKFFLRKLLVIFLIGLNVILFGYVLIRGSIMFFIEQPRYLRMFNQLSRDLIDYQAFRQSDRPAPLQIGGSAAVLSAENSYDFLIQVKNPNQDWIAKAVTARLVGGGAVIAEQTTFVYPGEEKFITFFSQSEASPQSGSIQIANVDWQRYQNFDEFASQRLDFATSNIKVTPVTRSSGTAGPITNLTFTLTNNSAYSYWQVGVYMVLLTGQSVGGINYLSLDQVKAGESRDVTIRWNQALPPINSVKILPEVDILDVAAYMPIN